MFNGAEIVPLSKCWEVAGSDTSSHCILSLWRQSTENAQGPRLIVVNKIQMDIVRVLLHDRTALSYTA